MLLHLIKKDFIIAKKYVWLMLIVVLLIPPFILWRTPELSGSLSFVISVTFAVFILLMYVSMKEFQYPKATALLCATPFPRSLVVMSKYGFCLVVFVICSVLYWIETLILPKVGEFHFDTVLAVFTGISLIISIYLPVQFKLGYEKTKFFFIVVIMATPFLLPQLTKIGGSSFLTALSSIPDALLLVILVIISFLVLVSSLLISIKIYSQKDLI